MKFNDIVKELRIPLNEASTAEEVTDTIDRIASKGKTITASWLIGQGKTVAKASVTYTEDDIFNILGKLRELNPKQDEYISSEIYNFIDVLKTKQEVEDVRGAEIKSQQRTVDANRNKRRQSRLGTIQTLTR